MTAQPTWIAYLRITQTGSKVTGYLQYVNADNQTYTRSQRSDVQGSISGSAITLKLDSFLGYSIKEADGEISGGKLILEFPNSGGHIDRYTFTSTTSTAWNRAVSNFEAHWKSAIDSQRKQAALLARKQAVYNECQRTLSEIYQYQYDLVAKMDNLEGCKQQLAMARLVVAARKEDVKRADDVATRAEQAAITDQEKIHADVLRTQVDVAKNYVDAALNNVDAAQDHVNNALDAIDVDKGRLRQERQRLQADMEAYHQLGEHITFQPNTGKYVAQVSAASTKIRVAPSEDSGIIREIKQGTNLAIVDIYGESCGVILPGAKMGYVSKDDLHLLAIDDVGRKIRGRLGIVTVLETPITLGPDPASRLLITAKRDTNVCIIGTADEHYLVLLQDASIGFIKRQNVRLLDAQVTQDEDGKLNMPKPAH